MIVPPALPIPPAIEVPPSTAEEIAFKNLVYTPNVHTVVIELAGGTLQIEWEEGGVVWMTGPTANVYEGRLDLSYFQG